MLSNERVQAAIISVIDSAIRAAWNSTGAMTNGLGSIDIEITHASVVSRSGESVVGHTYIEYAVYRHSSTPAGQVELVRIMTSIATGLTVQLVQAVQTATDGSISITTVQVSHPPVAQLIPQEVLQSTAVESADGLSDTAIVLVVLLVLALLVVLAYGMTVFIRGSGQGHYEVAKSKVLGCFGRGGSDGSVIVTNEAGPK